MEIKRPHKRKAYHSPNLTIKKIKLNFFFTKTLTDEFNIMGRYYIASSDAQESSSHDTGGGTASA